METIWTSKGYRIPKLLMSDRTMKDLTVYSQVKQEFPGPKPKVVCYKNNKDHFLVPYYYGEQQWGKPKKRFKRTYSQLDLEFDGSLRPYQLEIIDKVIKHFEEVSRGGIIAAGTGSGKSCLALYLITKLKAKTIIIVHKQILLDQWVEKIKQFIPQARIGIIQGSKIEIEDKDIIVGMVQTLTQREYPPNTFKNIEFIISDECHTMCSKTFNEIFFLIQTKYRLGLSATPQRKDGFDKVLEFHLGPIIVTYNKTIIEPSVSIYKLSSNDNIEMSMTRWGKTNLPALVTDLGMDDHRNSLLTSIILDRVSENRKILVLSDRVKQCERLKVFFEKNSIGGYVCDTFVGKKKKVDLEIAMEADVIFATYSIFKEGVDCPLLDTLVFATPKTDIVQAVGRILRQVNKNHPEVIDVVDTLEPLKNQYYRRLRYYKDKGYDITYYNQEKDEFRRLENVCLLK